jgi:radical SAM superfamily enzyme YgiQ (UPF0313 family)
MPNPLIERARWHLSRESGAIIKRDAALRVALVYPNTYHVGMSNLGMHAIYHLINARPDIACERAYMPDPGYERDRNLPLVTIESQSPLDRFDVIGFSLSFELDYIGAAEALRRARIPVFARERDGRQPLVIAGGPCASFNPEPLADVVDAFVIGEAEPVLDQLVSALVGAADKADALARLQAMAGVYVPSAYRAEYSARGEFVRMAPTAGAPATIQRLHVADLDDWPTHTRIFSPDTEFGNMFLVEICRGCAHACRFCVASPCYRPYRHRALQQVLDLAAQGLTRRRTVGLVAAAVTDHPELEAMVAGLRRMKARISLSSLRADGVTPGVIEALAESGARSITFAPEAGSEKLRRRLRKAISDEQYLAAVRLAAANGIRRVRLYFMVGLPGETEADIAAIARLVHRVRRDASLVQVTASVSAFVPKPRTAFERAAMAPAREIEARLKALRSALHIEPGASMAAESANWAFIQAALARGDRRLGAVIARACDGGGTLAAWRGAFTAEGLETAYFASRPRDADEPLPWSHVGSDG